MASYEEMSKDELLAEAKRRGVEVKTSMTKAKLKAALKAAPPEALEVPTTVEVETTRGTVVSTELGLDGKGPVTAQNPSPKAVLG